MGRLTATKDAEEEEKGGDDTEPGFEAAIWWRPNIDCHLPHNLDSSVGGWWGALARVSLWVRREFWMGTVVVMVVLEVLHGECGRDATGGYRWGGRRKPIWPLLVTMIVEGTVQGSLNDSAVLCCYICE